MSDRDVVEQGREPAAGTLPAAVRWVAIAIVLATAAFVVSRSGLLSADPPPGRGTGEGPSQPAPPPVLAQVDDHLVRLGQEDMGDGPRFPRGYDGNLVPVPSSSGTARLAATAGGQLFRFDPDDEGRWVPIGPADVAVAAARTPGRVLVQRGRRVVEVEVGVGRETASEPFPGFAAVRGTALGLLAAQDRQALLIGRLGAATQDGSQLQKLALAYPARAVAAGTVPSTQTLGFFGEVIGVVEDRVLTAPRPCFPDSCRLRVVNVSAGRVLTRDVAPPKGYSFVGTPLPGSARRDLVGVLRVDGPRAALARIVPGGDNALLVPGTDGADLDAGVVDGPDGSALLVVDPRGDRPEEVRWWQPERGGPARRVRGAAELPEAARLVCACG